MIKRGRPVGVVKKIETSEIGSFLRNYRKNKKIGLKEFSKQLNMSIQFLSNVERGIQNLPYKYIKALAKQTNTSEEILAKKVALSNMEFINQLK